VSIQPPAVRLLEEEQVKYLLLIYFDEAWQRLSLAERQRIYQGQMDVASELIAKGQYLGGNPLEPAETATSVRVRDGKRLMIDGPFADLDEALAIAARGPVASVGTVEVRPVREGPPAA
jgi:hypothetical protein